MHDAVGGSGENAGMRTRLALIALSVLLLAASATACTTRAASTPVAPTATVLKIVDGDTVDVVDDNRGRLRIRLLGIDTPETRKPGYEPACWGQQATESAAANTAWSASGRNHRSDTGFARPLRPHPGVSE